MGLADIHIHTNYSYDGTASVDQVLRKARHSGLDVIAVTDHDEIAGSLLAEEIAPRYGIEAIPGIEITTAEGDLLGLFIREKIAPGLSLIETVMKIRELGGVCVAPHPMAGGFGMKSLSAYSILKALRYPKVADTLIGIETHNGTSLDRMGNRYARILANSLDIACTGSSDAHILETIGFGATEFTGKTAKDLLKALRLRATHVRKQSEWSAARVLGSWGIRYAGNMLSKLSVKSQPIADVG